MSMAAPGNYLAGSTFTVSSSGTTGLRWVAARALDLGEDGEGEEDLPDEYRYQDAHRQIKSVLHLVCLKNRVKVAIHFGIVPSGQKARCMLDAIGHVDPAAQVYHWVIHRCHACLRENLVDKLYEHVIIATPKEEQFKWIVRRGNELCYGITDLMAEIKHAILHTETWRAAVREHAAYDYAPTILSELTEVLAEICTNLDMACLKRPDPWVIQRMVENHALSLLHLEEALLDFDEILETGEPVDDARTARELRMHYNILFSQDYTPKDYMAGIGSTDTKAILHFLDIQKSMIRQFRGQWN